MGDSVRFDWKRNKGPLQAFIEVIDSTLRTRSGVEISLEGDCKAAGELRVFRNKGGYFIEPIGNCEGFSLDGTKLAKAAPLREGAVLSCAGYRISIPRLVWAAPAAPGPDPAPGADGFLIERYREVLCR